MDKKTGGLGSGILAVLLGTVALIFNKKNTPKQNS